MKDLFKEIKSDLPASIIVFFVALPLCLGIALASGAPLFAGIIAGIVGGIIVGYASGSSLGVSGPAAGLAVIVLTSIQELGSWEVFLVAVVLSGVMQLIMGYAKAGVVAYFFPSSVIKGMLAAIGILIILKQLPHSVGYDKDYEGDMDFVQANSENTFTAITHALGYINQGALIISLVSMAILILWEKVLLKKGGIFKIIQAPLVVVVVGILLNLLFQSETIPFALGEGHVVTIPVATSFSEFFGQFTLPDFSALGNTKVYTIALTIAIIGSIETLLCVEASDKIDPERRVTPANRELKAQGIGNIISGLVGGLPITQVIVRSSANISFGAKSKLSAILHGFFLLISAIAIPRILNLIPLASLACILFLVGYKLTKPSLVKSMYKLGWDQFIPFMATIIGIVFTDLLIGIGIGFAVAVFYLLRNNYRNSYYFHPESTKEGEVRMVLSEEVSFLNKGNIRETLDKIPNDTSLVIDATNSKFIDKDILDIINDFKIHANINNINLTIKGIPELEPA